MYGSRPWYQASGQAKYSSDEDHYIQVSAYDQPPQSSAPYLIIPGTPSTASVGSPSTGSATSFDAQTTGHQYPSFSYTDFGPDQASQGYTTPQPSIPVVFEDLRSPSRRRRRAPARRSGSAAAADQREEFDFPQRQQYQVTQQGVSGEAEIMSRPERHRLIRSLQNRQINTLIELRRAERILVASNDPDLLEPLTGAWAHYVNSNNLLNELRSLTRIYLFSSECLDEAKWKVIEDPTSGRSWNYCWLVLMKIQDDNLITKFAQWTAAKPEVWGNQTPSNVAVAQLITVLSAEWNNAVTQLLRHWETTPTNHP